MERKIRGYRRGVFSYERPEILIYQNNELVDTISFRVQTGEEYHGTFQIGNELKTEIRGWIEQDEKSEGIRVDGGMFSGEVCWIHFAFLADENYRLGTHKAVLRIVSDCGVRKVPVQFKVVKPFIVIDDKEVNDWKEFAKIAKSDPMTAISVFANEEFVRVFLYDHPEWVPLYRSLMKSANTAQAMEEFLVAAGLKEQLRYEVDFGHYQYEAAETGEAVFEDEIKLRKTGSGTGEIRVSCEGKFLGTVQDRIRAEHFFQKDYAVRFRVSPEECGPGLHLGAVCLELPTRSVRVPVSFHRENSQKVKDARKMRKGYLKAEQCYLDFRRNKISRDEYVNQMLAALAGINQIREEETADLIETYVYLSADRAAFAENLLQVLERKSALLEKFQPIHYCGVRFLRALADKQPEVTEKACDYIRDMYENRYEHPILLWFLLQLDEELQKDAERKLKEIRRMFRAGSASPLLILEAAQIYNANPYMLNKPDEFEMFVAGWSLKHGMLQKEAAMQYCYLVGRSKNPDAAMFDHLVKIYRMYGEREILEILCSVLLATRRSGPKVFGYYALGVEADLKLNGLYEAYIDSVPQDLKGPYHSSIYTYFRYDNRLSARKKAMLYANIVANRNMIPEVEAQYRNVISIFTKEMFDKRAMNEFMPVLYERLYEQNTGSRRMSAGLVKLSRKVLVTCRVPKMRSIIVCRPAGEEAIALLGGKAWVTLEEPMDAQRQLLCEDGDGNRYCMRSCCTVERPFVMPDEVQMESVVTEQLNFQLPRTVKTTKVEQSVEEEIQTALFTEEGIDRILPDFLKYAQGKLTQRVDKRLVKSFFCYYSFRYLYYNNGGNDELFGMLFQEAQEEDMEIGRMALLKWMSRRAALKDEEKKLAEAWIRDFYGQGIVLPFFKDLGRTVDLPFGIRQRYYVEYHANPKKRVTIHYATGSLGSMEEERMPHMYKGIFVKEFILFQDEELFYYITEEGEEEASDPDRVAEDKLWRIEPGTYEGEDRISLYGLLNLLTYEKALGETDPSAAEQMKSLVTDYAAMRQVLKEKFKAL
ncbi:MAG: hypothetical protein IJM26_11140 [Lachnospiraceae bacterium]|nr:hypothetical protein [Lachnospiraceae bacterium]